MDGEVKKWILDMSTSESDSTATKLELDPALIESLPAHVLGASLFINSATWMPMTTKEAIDSVKEQDASSNASKDNLLVIRFALAIYRLTSSTNATDQTDLSAISSKAASCISEHLVLRMSIPPNSIKGPSSLEMMDSFLSSVYAQHSRLDELACLELIESLSDIYARALKLDNSTFETWYNRLLDSKLRNFLFLHNSTRVASLQLQLELKLFLCRFKTHPIPVESSRIFWNVLTARIKSVDEIDPFMPVIAHLTGSSHPHYMSGALALLMLQKEYLKSDGKIMALDKAFDEEDVFSSLSSLLCGSNDIDKDRSLKLITVYLNLSASHSTISTLIDSVTRASMDWKIDVSTHSHASKVIELALSKLSEGERFQYLLNWLLNFEELSSMDRALTKSETLEETKPIAKRLESGTNFMKLLIPKPLNPGSATNKASPSSGTKPLIEEINESPTISVPVYHDLMSLLIMRMDIPDYFFCLNDTKLYDKEKFEHDDFRVKLFQRLANHFWNILNSLISYMPTMDLLTSDNPILLMPEGVKTPIQVPPWFDSLLIIFALHGMKSDFSTNMSSKDVEKCVKTLVDCASVKQLSKNPFALRLRQSIALVKSKPNNVVDEANKFSIIMWLCYHVPLTELKPSVDTLDEKIFEALVTTINDTLADHRPNIKILGLDLVLFITHMLQRSALQASETESKSSNPKALTRLPHLPQSIFDAIIRSFTFRELELVELALETTISMVELRSKEEAILLEWSSSLMKAIAYEIDYVQKQDLLEVYLRYLPKLMPLLGMNLLVFSHPLLVRLVSLLDLGTFRMTTLSLKCIEVLMRQTWPRIHVESELIFGALATVWIDQVWVLPSERPNLTDTVKRNVEIVKDDILTCLRTLIAIVDPSIMQEMTAEMVGLDDLKDLYDLTTALVQTRIAAISS